MSDLQTVLMWFSLVAAGVLSAVGFAVWCDQHQVFPGRRLLRAFRRLPWPVQFFLLVFSLHMIVHGSIKTNAVGDIERAAQQRGRDIPVACNKAADTFPSRDRNVASPLGADEVDDSDIARGYRLVEVSTNADYSYAMPTNAVLCGHWHQRGAYDDVTLIDFENWRFLHGSNEISRLWAFTWGMARVEIRDVAHEIAPVGSPMSAIPFVSRLWTASTTNDTRLVTWENFAVGRIPRDEFEQSLTDENRFLSAQIELSANGDFITRSNSVETSYRRVDPNDWDGDGWTNDEDPDPKRWTGGDFGLAQSLPEGANAAAYYWIDIRVPYNTPVSFVGDAPSSLADPSFIARAGETYRVYLLVGKRYEVTSVRPVSVVAQSTDEAIVCGEGSSGMSVVYPVDICAMEGNGSGFRMVVSSAELGGVFEWTESCCPITGYGDCFWYAHAGQCFCGGCYAEGLYAYEGYSLPCEGGYCGCPYHDADDSFVTRVSGGLLPVTRFVPPGQKLEFEVEYEGCRPSDSEGDIVATAVMSGNGVRQTTATDELTSVKVELTAVYEAPENHNPSRHVYGVGELVSFNVQPNSSNVIFRTIRHDTADDSGYGYELFGSRESCPAPYASEYRCPISASYQPPIRVCCGDCEYSPTLEIVEPQEVITTGAAWGENAVDPQFYDGDRKCWPFGAVGSAALVTTNYVGPMNVSFQGIAMTEVPCDVEDIITGSFATNHYRTHTTSAGAGELHMVQDKNFFFVDAARSGMIERNWMPDSTLNWNIPIGWHRIRSDYYDGKTVSGPDFERCNDNESRKLIIGGRIDKYMLKRHIDMDGTYRTEKFGHWISRSRWCQVILDGITLRRSQLW